MIVPMLKLTLLCRAADRTSALAALRDLGVLHVTPSVAPTGASLDAARAKADLLKRILEAIPAKTPEGAQKSGTDPEKLASDLQSLIDTRKAAADRIETTCVCKGASVHTCVGAGRRLRRSYCSWVTATWEFMYSLLCFCVHLKIPK